MNNCNKKNYVVAVDLNDNEIKKVEKIRAHKQAILHRAFSIFLVNQNKILIQKRAKTKYHSPSLWANACCSHPISQNVKEEANARLYQELGINEKINLKEIFSFIYFTKLENLFEYEFDHVFIGNYYGKIKLNKNEAEKYCWIKIEKLEKMLIKKPKMFANWFLICAPVVINYLKK